jgi:hypothetical protein
MPVQRAKDIGVRDRGGGGGCDQELPKCELGLGRGEHVDMDLPSRGLRGLEDLRQIGIGVPLEALAELGIGQGILATAGSLVLVNGVEGIQPGDHTYLLEREPITRS